MPDLGIGQQGTLKSTPKLTRINGDDNLAVVYRNLGNNHAYPFIFADTFTVASGVTAINMRLASDVKYHGYELATYAKVIVTPNYDAGDFYVTKDVDNNIIRFTCEKACVPPIYDITNTTSGTIDVIFMVGEDAAFEGIYCRGNTGAAPNFP